MILSEHEVEGVKEYLFNYSRSELVQYDLLDHICCTIEEEMEAGKNYESARSNVFEIFKPDYIKELDQTTYYLTKPKLYMSRKSIISGIIGLFISILGVIGKQFNMSGSNEVLVLGALVIIFGFLFTGILTLNKGMQVSRYKIANWIAFIGGMVIIAGITLFILKYAFPALILLSAGGVLFIVYFVLNSSHTRSLLS